MVSVLDDEIRIRAADEVEQRLVQGLTVDELYSDLNSLLRQGCGQRFEQVQKLGVRRAPRRRLSHQCGIGAGGCDIAYQQFDGGSAVPSQNRSLVDRRLALSRRRVDNDQDVAEVVHTLQSSPKTALGHIRSCA